MKTDDELVRSAAEWLDEHAARVLMRAQREALSYGRTVINLTDLLCGVASVSRAIEHEALERRCVERAARRE